MGRRTIIRSPHATMGVTTLPFTVAALATRPTRQLPRQHTSALAQGAFSHGAMHATPNNRLRPGNFVNLKV